MRRLRSPGLVAVIAVAGIALPTAAVGAQPLGTAAPAANSVTFRDSTGENAAAPDITTIVVSNNDAGVVSFRINVPNRPTLGQDMLIELLVDTDNNAATGDPELAGTDYALQLIQGEIILYKWDGTGFTRRFGDPSAVTLSFSYNGGVTIQISAAELGNTRRFRFITEVVSGLVVDPLTGELDGTNAVSDVAPGGGVGLYPFEVKIGKPTLVVKKFAPSPAKPAAGKSFSLRLRAARSDTGALLQGGRVTCVGRVGSSSLRSRSAGFVGREAVCTWAIPATAKGKTFRGSVAVVFEGLRTSRSFSGRIG